MTETAEFDPSALLNFDCPRCKQTVEDRYYGPCANCRRELKASLGGERRDIRVEEYVPKMNVVPNQIASKE